MSMGREYTFCAPINVDAFILNPAVCDKGLTKIAPITQPDYRGLRLNSAEIQHDLLPNVDLSSTQPSKANPRVTAIEAQNTLGLDPAASVSDGPLTPPTRDNRVGIYLHWSLPRLYRAATGGAAVEGDLPTKENTSANPTFRPVPNRWLIVRSIRNYEPSTAPGIKQYDGWVIESDRLWNLQELGPDVDLETDVSPYVNYHPGDEADPGILDRQATFYIGRKTPVSDWTEEGDDVARVPLTVMNSSNFFFADNTHHNSNVFSMVDTLDFVDSAGNKSYLKQAMCDYAVIGWHSKIEDDPLSEGGLDGTFQDKLRALFLEASEEFMIKNGRLKRFTRLICHGAIYNVSYNRDQKPVTKADDYAKLFTAEEKMEPIAVGVTPLDSVLSFLQAHQTNVDEILGTGSLNIAADILSLSEMLYAVEDGYDGRVKASDLIDSHNFMRASGGSAWQYNETAVPGQPSTRPSAVADAAGQSEVDYLVEVNDLQSLYDAAVRKLKLMQWRLFALWWNYISDPDSSSPTTRARYTTDAWRCKDQVMQAAQLAENTRSQMSKITGINVDTPAKVKVRSVAREPYFQRKDPTVCIAGMDSGWPLEYLGKLPVRLMMEVPNFFREQEAPPLVPVRSSGDFNLDLCIKVLVREALKTQDHDPLLGFKQWTGQPWCPLFLEWEAAYFHIPFEKWSVALQSSPVSNNHAKVRYVVNGSLVDDPDSVADRRTVAGRIMILPQPVFSLQAIVAQVLDIAGTDLPPDLETPAQKKTFVEQIGKLKFVSAELQGITSNLLTIAEGSHAVPNFTLPGQEQPVPLRAAADAVASIGMSAFDLATIQNESAATPYGRLVDFTSSPNAPFKGVTHGQLLFTKMSIVDKFGQAICPISPDLPLRQPDSFPETVFPCLGDQVCPGFAPNSTELNTVTPLTTADPHLPGEYPLCPYIQLTPAINQETRLNAAFVVQSQDSNDAFTGWRVASDWDQPIWGWVVVNYADYGLQFFTTDGVFFVEMNLGGPTGTIKNASWLPFDPPTAGTVMVSPQLDQLVGRMNHPTTGAIYLRSFWDMITQAVETMPFPPPEYAASATAIIGKPLALVNVGFSLELATEPLTSQTTLPPAGTTQSESEILFNYKFPIKIGDMERPFDGVVGYFDTDNTTTGQTDWENLHSYFTTAVRSGVPIIPRPPTPEGDPRVLIEPSSLPSLSPYYVDPTGPLKNNSFAETQATHLMIKTMIVDPYTPLHVYSPILPITSLQLPSWTIQQGLHKISAFFALGPLLLTRDIPTPYNSSVPLTAESWLDQQRAQAPPDPNTAPIRLPLIGGGAKGTWKWLQPYSVPPAGGEGDEEETKYNALEVGVDDGKVRFDPGPYTMVEGFLQLVRRLDRSDIRI